MPGAKEAKRHDAARRPQTNIAGRLVGHPPMNRVPDAARRKTTVSGLRCHVAVHLQSHEDRGDRREMRLGSLQPQPDRDLGVISASILKRADRAASSALQNSASASSSTALCWSAIAG
jgi:hypothetical protein